MTMADVVLRGPVKKERAAVLTITAHARLIGDGCVSFNDKCAIGIEPIKENIKKQPLNKKLLGLYYESNFQGIKVYHIHQKKFRNTILLFLEKIFFFILFANLCGLIPYGSTATGNIAVTATLALVTFVVVEIAGMREQGVGYLSTIFYWPHDVPLAVKMPMTLIITLTP